MFRVVGDEVWLDGWLVARLNVNLPATLRQLVEDHLTGKKYRDENALLEQQIKELEADIEQLEAENTAQIKTIEELKAELADCRHD